MLTFGPLLCGPPVGGPTAQELCQLGLWRRRRRACTVVLPLSCSCRQHARARVQPARPEIRTTARWLYARRRRWARSLGPGRCEACRRADHKGRQNDTKERSHESTAILHRVFNQASRLPHPILLSIVSRAFCFLPCSPLLLSEGLPMAAPRRLTLWLTVALGLLQLNCAVSDHPSDPNKIVGHINYTPPRLGQN